MQNAADLQTFKKEISCTYRGETYCVRDKGAVLRRARAAKRKRPLDETWTFGTPSPSDGYTSLAGAGRHVFRKWCTENPMIAARWADARVVMQVLFKPDWKSHGKTVPFKRNDKILETLPQGLIATLGSGITVNIVDKARALGIRVKRIEA